MLGWFAMLVGNKVANDVKSNRLSREYVKENGLDHPEWNKELQMRLWRKWFDTSNNRSMTQMEQYQSAIAELESQGYKWNPEWDPFTPKAGSYLTVDSEKSAIAYNEEEARKEKYLRFGENMQLQYEILKYYFWGDDLIIRNDYYVEKDYGSFGNDAYAPYEYKIKLINKNDAKDTAKISLQEVLDMIIPPEIIVNKTEKQIEAMLKTVFSRTYKTGETKSIFDPPRIFFLGDFMWYDDIIHYPFSDTFIPHPSTEKLASFGKSKIAFDLLKRDRQVLFEKNIEMYFYRNLPDGHKWYIKKFRYSSVKPTYINVQCNR